MRGSAWQDAIASDQRLWLVTGAAGFIGSHIVNILLELGQRVVGLDNFSTGHRRNLAAVQSAVGGEASQQFRLIDADLRDFDVCMDASTDADYVLHQAALGSVSRSMNDPLGTHSVNVGGTLNVFMASLARGVRKTVYASSWSVYGDDSHLPKIEHRTGKPLSPYATTKQIGELYAGMLSDIYGMPIVGLRYFNVVGPRQSADGPYAAVVPRWVEALRSGERPIIYGDGEASRDFCPVSNVAQANLLAAVSGESANGQVYNIALGKRTTLNELYGEIRELLVGAGVGCADVRPTYDDPRSGDVLHSLADISKARTELGYAPDVSLAACLHRIAST